MPLVTKYRVTARFKGAKFTSQDFTDKKKRDKFVKEQRKIEGLKSITHHDLVRNIVTQEQL